MTRTARITLRTGVAGDARRLHALIAANQTEGHLLPRTLADVAHHAERFVVAVRNRKIVGSAELAALSPQVAEVRSLAVDPSARRRGVGTMIVDALRARARREGFDRLCAFTHVPGYFMPMGFSIVPHLWLTEKVYTDCVKCPLFRRCGQYAMVLPLDPATETVDTRDTIMVARHA
jgi:amino-acid N-acetyltransferase